MNLLDRIGDWFGAFIRNLFGSSDKDPAQAAHAVIAKQKRSLKRLKNSLTELIFQRKKFETQLESLEGKRLNMQQDLELAAHQDRDDLAIRLMEELDLLEKETEETRKSLQMVTLEINSAKQVEFELSKQIEKSESQLAVLISRSQSVQMREDLQSQFAKIHEEISHVKPGLNVVEENILRLEARLENLQGPDQSWKDEVAAMRKQRTDHVRQARLQQFKMQLKGRQLPGKVLIPEIVTTH